MSDNVVAELAGLVDRLAGLPATAGDDATRIEVIAGLEKLKAVLRRLFTDPASGVIQDCDPRGRRFDGVLARLLVYRDQHCRDPFCDAPIRHLDHIKPFAAGGSIRIAMRSRVVEERAGQMPSFCHV